MAVSNIENSALRQLFHDDKLLLAAVRLYYAQRAVAHYFELGYLNLAHFAEIAGEVRLTAHEARTQHLMTSGLMKKFMMTSKHVVITMLPMIRDAVDLGDPDVIKGTFEQIIELAEDMKKESESTKESYYKIQGKVQKHVEKVDNKNASVKKTNEENRKAEELEKIRQQQAETSAKRLKESKESSQKVYTELRTRKKAVFEEIEALNDKPTFVDNVLGSVAIGAAAGIVGGIIGGGIALITGLCIHFKRQAQIALKQKDYDKLDKEQKDLRKKLEQLAIEEENKRFEAQTKLKLIEQLNRDFAVGLGDVQHLKEAATHLGDVDKMFTLIILFWEDMAAATKFLRDDTKAGEVYLKKLEDTRYQTRLLKSVERAEQNWGFFGQLCESYALETEKEIGVIYEFLSKPLDSLSAEARKQRQEAVLNELKKEIDQVYPPKIEEITNEEEEKDEENA